MCIADVFDENYKILINEFKCKFYKLYEDFKLPMTLKIHVIVDHYADYFEETGKIFKSTNDEHHEGIHHSVKVFESNKGFHMKKKHLGGLIHQAKCLQSILTFNGPGPVLWPRPSQPRPSHPRLSRPRPSHS